MSDSPLLGAYGSFLDGPLRMLGSAGPEEEGIRQAAWVARCVGRGEAAPLGREDISALAGLLRTRRYRPGTVLYTAGTASAGVWIVRSGRVELSVGSGGRRVVVHLLQPGDVDGDVEYLLDMPFPYTARAVDDATVLHLDSSQFEKLLVKRPPIARRWLSSIAMRLAASQSRLLGVLGRSLPEQVATLLIEESTSGEVPLPQRTLAAMLGVRRPSLNKVLKEFEGDGLIRVRYGAIDIVDAEALALRTA
ncbi:transcriptional regulator, Crp/Fnr family [Haloechinothrix alba]|uniref:Transcriptional regulator, Crp/Fnr family n=1 Tax=Haloechinothrix alba TaxID=664784 RepID=A0A238WRQ8_9PSEU|nr:Crp/Fnr family transcriptional regulator [Haloechinothrix alba]SNR48934.1 transcriptional regulator, Crp/Fnr family [Haloechinothrix alba]